VAIKESVQQIGIGLRQSSSGKMMVLNLLADNNHPKRISVYRMASATSFTSTASGFPVGFLHVGKYVWLKIEDDNTNLKFYISFDGIEFIQVFSESRTSHMTTTGPDQMMFQLNNQGSTNFQMLGRLCHWSRLT
jgi:hypothetical protein